MMPLLGLAARHASRTNEVPALPVPRPATFAALRTARNASGCVLRPRRIYRCAFVLSPYQRRPCLALNITNATGQGTLCGNGGAEDKASGDDLVAEMSDMHYSTVT